MISADWSPIAQPEAHTVTVPYNYSGASFEAVNVKPVSSKNFNKPG